ncbi:MAG: type II toxin-antitoxin system Phd/YefM family antitoxin [Planctomycetes bacterium]|nr:type II toxin-antitoxin system Phd/YefM family antitoxin [Planctomycetota bacterium]
MLEIQHEIIEKDGKKEFAVLPYEEFVRVRDELEEFEDLRLLREAKEQEKSASTCTIEDAKKQLGIE